MGAARRAAQDDCKSSLSAPLEILQFPQDWLAHFIRKSKKAFYKVGYARLHKLSEYVHFGASTVDDSVAIMRGEFTKLRFKISEKVRR
jgi:hypothetical protein